MDILEQYRELKESLSLPHTVETRREVENKLDDLAHQIAQRMLDVSSGLSDRLRRDAENLRRISATQYGGDHAHYNTEAAEKEQIADALDAAEAERAASEEIVEILTPVVENRRMVQAIAESYADLDIKWKVSTLDYFKGVICEPLERIGLLKSPFLAAKERIAKRGGA